MYCHRTPRLGLQAGPVREAYASTQVLAYVRAHPLRVRWIRKSVTRNACSWPPASDGDVK